jgi:hypothetical protein
MKKNGNHGKNGQCPATPAFVARAERALRRAAQNVQAENHRQGLPVIIWKNGKTAAVPA